MGENNPFIIFYPWGLFVIIVSHPKFLTIILHEIDEMSTLKIAKSLKIKLPIIFFKGLFFQRVIFQLICSSSFHYLFYEFFLWFLNESKIYVIYHKKNYDFKTFCGDLTPVGMYLSNKKKNFNLFLHQVCLGVFTNQRNFFFIQTTSHPTIKIESI